MADIYADIAEVEASLQHDLCEILELRGADAQQQAMRASYLSMLELPSQAKALEVGCGTGVVSRYIKALPDIGSVMGIDPSSIFVQKARQLSEGMYGIEFTTGDARELPFADASFDLVVFHTVLCHIPGPELALAEARRVLRPGGQLAIFDGDYAAATVAVDDHDPLQATVDAMVNGYVENLWLIRQLPRVIQQLGLELKGFHSYGYSAVHEPAYMLTLIDRGIALMLASGLIGKAQGVALKAEALRRIETGEFFGHIPYISAVAKKVHM